MSVADPAATRGTLASSSCAPSAIAMRFPHPRARPYYRPSRGRARWCSCAILVSGLISGAALSADLPLAETGEAMGVVEAPPTSRPISPSSLSDRKGRSFLAPVPWPDLEATDAPVRAALGRARAVLEDALADTESGDAALAESYGELGLLYQAHLVFEPATVCFANAERLGPDDYRWPYYQGYLAQQQGHLPEAIRQYRRAMQLNPRAPWVRMRGALAELGLGDFDDARQNFLSVLEAPAFAAAARVGLGRIALEQGAHETAVQQLEKALEVAPEADQIHYLLAMAYRGRGDTERAITHLKQRGEREPGFPDPLVDVLPGLSAGQRMLFHLGINAMYRDDFAQARKLFQEGLVFDPENHHARISLARILFLSGEVEAAEVELARVLEAHPDSVLGLILMGVLRGDAGDSTAAVSYLRLASELDPDSPDIRFLLADAMARAGDFAGAAANYGEAAKRDPRNRAARRGEALALARTGIGDLALKARLVSMLEVAPEDPLLLRLQVGLLAASPDPSVRDGAEAVRRALLLRRADGGQDAAEWLAMALAEKGDFSGAVAAQEQVLQATMAVGPPGAIPRLLAQLDAYRSGQPWRIPWAEADLIANWPWVGSRSVFRDYPSDTPF